MFVIIQSSYGSANYSRTFTIAIKHANDTPTDIDLFSNAFDEKRASATIVRVLFTSNVDSGDTHTYNLVGVGAIMIVSPLVALT